MLLYLAFLLCVGKCLQNYDLMTGVVHDIFLFCGFPVLIFYKMPHYPAGKVAIAFQIFIVFTEGEEVHISWRNGKDRMLYMVLHCKFSRKKQHRCIVSLSSPTSKILTNGEILSLLTKILRKGKILSLIAGWCQVALNFDLCWFVCNTPCARLAAIHLCCVSVWEIRNLVRLPILC